MIKKIISGRQTGADQAALDAAIKLDEWTVNEELMKSCMALSEDADLSGADASTVIMKELWKQLRETHKLRVVK